MYVPKNLNKWVLPESYIGPEYPEFYIFLGRNRDSDLLRNCNFDVAIERLRKIGEESENTWQFIRDSHWLVGWVEYILIHESAEEFLKLADSIQNDLNDYPSLDDDKLCEMENQEADRIWKTCYNVSERIEYVRNHRSQFEFRNYSDMISCVRGEYFDGYASELIY